MAGITYQDGASKRSIASVYYQDGASKRTIQNVYYQDGANRRLVYTAYTPMTVSAGNVSGTSDNTEPSATTSTATATVTGGNSPKTYSWTRVSGATFTINSPVSQSTTFTQTGHPGVGTYTGTYHCTVTDDTASVSSNNITVTIFRT